MRRNLLRQETALRDEVVAHRLGAVLGQNLVVFRRTGAVGVPVDQDSRAGIGADLVVGILQLTLGSGFQLEPIHVEQYRAVQRNDETAADCTYRVDVGARPAAATRSAEILQTDKMKRIDVSHK